MFNLMINGSTKKLGECNIDFEKIRTLIDVNITNVISGINLTIYGSAYTIESGQYTHGKVWFKFITTTELSQSETITMGDLLNNVTNAMRTNMGPAGYYKLIYEYHFEISKAGHEAGYSYDGHSIRSTITAGNGTRIMYEHLGDRDTTCKYVMIYGVNADESEWASLGGVPILHAANTGQANPTMEGAYIKGTLEW